MELWPLRIGHSGRNEGHKCKIGGGGGGGGGGEGRGRELRELVGGSGQDEGGYVQGYRGA